MPSPKPAVRSSSLSRRAVPRRRGFAPHPLVAAICAALAGPALALPQGGQVVAGQATIATPTPTTQVVTQTTQRAVIDWTSFSIAAGERVRFNQPSASAVTLNRVVGYDPSFILGQMSSNGRVFLVNPYGVVFGAGARVDVGGLVVSTLSIANGDFMAGRYTFSADDGVAAGVRGAIRNDGEIRAPGGTVAMVGPRIVNTGSIEAHGGRVALAATGGARVDLDGDGLVVFETRDSSAAARLEQLGRVQADGGSIELRAQARAALADTVLNVEGVTQARSLGARDGRIVIDAGGGAVTVAGRVDASGVAAGERGGLVTVTGEQVTLAASARLDASGDAGGGAIRIGGGFHGADAGLRNARTVVVERGASFAADAVQRGDGGTVAIWSDGSTRFEGTGSARGGTLGGNGGFVEVSGRDGLHYDGRVDLRAPLGATGTLLLDPRNLTIDQGSATSSTNIQSSTIEGQLATANVTIDTNLSGADAGTLTVLTGITWASNHNLTLDAQSTLTVSAGAVIRNTADGDLNLRSNGAVVLNGSVDLDRGNLLVTNYGGGTTGAASFTAGAASSITTGGGNVTILTVGDQVIAGAITTSGDGGTTPRAGGDVQLTATSGSITTAAITADGGNGTSRPGGDTGGAGGDVSITVQGIARTLVTGPISARGGSASANSNNNGDGSTGGAGGSVTLRNLSGGDSTLGTIVASGGTGGASGTGNADGGDGGAGGAIVLDSVGGTLSLSDLTTQGGSGVAGAGTGNPGGSGAGGTVAITFATAAAGTLDLGSAVVQAASANATAGGAASTLRLAAVTENVTLTDALLTRPASGSWVLSGLDSASITAGTGTLDASAFSGTVAVQLTAGAGSLTGNGVNTTLSGLAGGSAFVVGAGDAGSVDGTAFTGVGNLLGGAGNDSFVIGAAGSLSGSLQGGGGTNTLDLSARGNAITLTQAGAVTGSGVAGAVAGITSLVGNGANTTFVGGNAGQTWQVTGADAISVGGQSHAGIGNLHGGSGDDVFAFAAGGSLSGALAGGGGSNTLDLSARATANVSLGSSGSDGTASGIGAGYSGIATLVGNGGSSVLTGRNVASTWNVTASQAGTVSDGTTTTAFSGFAGLVGGSAADAYTLAAGAAIGTIDGGSGGGNSLVATAGATEGLTLADGSLQRTVAGTVTLANIGAATLAGGSGANALDGSAFTGTLTLLLSGGADTLTGNGAGTTLRANPAGSTFTVSGANAGTADASTFTQVANLAGGAGVDTVVLTGAGTLSGNVTGAGGNDTLDLSASAGSITITQAGGITGSGIGGTVSGIANVVGNGANTTFQGADVDQTWAITGGNAFTVGGSSYSGIGSLLGGSGNDAFVFGATGSLTGSLDGGAGSNTLDLSARALANFTRNGGASAIGGSWANIGTLVGNGSTSQLTGGAGTTAWAVTGTNSGTLVDAGGSLAFSGITGLNGGAGSDSFVVGASGSLSGTASGGGGSNSLDLSARAAADVALTTASSGSASGFAAYSGITTLIGNGSSLLTGTANTATWLVSGAGQGSFSDVSGTAQWSGIGSLAGGAGADTFQVGAAGSLAGGIAGGTGSNVLDLSARATANVGLTGVGTGTASGLGAGFSGVATLVGNGSSSTLTGPAAGSTWTVDGSNSGNVSGVAFSGMATLVGGAGGDTFAFGNAGTLSGSLDGGGGANTLTYASRNAAPADVTLTSASGGVASGIGAGYANIGSLVGNGLDSTLTGSALASTWTVTGHQSGTVVSAAGSTSFSGMPRLAGGAGADAFVLTAAGSVSAIDGGSGAANTLSATAAAGGDVVVLSDAALTRLSGAVTLANLGTATIVGGAGSDVVDGSAFSGTLTLQASAGFDALTGNGSGTTLVAAAGGGTVVVNGVNAGSVGTSVFSGVGNLRGGAGADTFALTGLGALSGGITGVGGNDTLSLAGLAVGNVTLTSATSGSASGVAGGYSGIGTLAGNGSSSTLTGTNGASTWSITGNGSGTVDAGAGVTTWSGMASLAGGSGSDVFRLGAAGILAGSIAGGGGANTLDLSAHGVAHVTLSSATSGSATDVAGGYSGIATLIGNGATVLTGTGAASTWTVTGSGSGSVDDGVGTTAYAGVASLVGGAGTDTFRLGAGGSLAGTVNGGGGTNTLDLSARASANVALTSNTSGSTTGIAGFANISALVGNGAGSVLTGPNAASTWAVTGNGSGMLNGSTSFAGMVSLVGGNAADAFVFSAGGALSGSLDGGAGTNSLALNGPVADFALASATSGSASGIAGGYANVGTLAGNGSTSTLTGRNVATTWQVSGAGSGSVDDGVGTTAFSGIASLAGGSGADVFRIGASGSLLGSVAAGGGANTLDLSARASADVALASATAGSASGIGGGYTGVATLVGNGTTSRLTGTAADSTWNVTGHLAGSVSDGVGTTTFSGVTGLVGGTGADSFTLGAGLALSSIDGGGGTNRLAATAGANENLTLANGQLARSASSTVALANLGAATLTGGAGANVIDASGWTGGRTLVVQATTGLDSVTGNGAGTTLVGTAAASTFNLTGSDAGTLTSGANSTAFSAVSNLTGGAGNDTFVIQEAGSLAGNLDGGSGANTLDLSNRVSASIVFSSSGSSVTGGGVGGTLANIGNLIGNSVNTTLQGLATGQSFAITGNNQITVDGSQVFQGVGTLRAGVGNDSISGSAPFSLAGSILDDGGITTLSGTIRTGGRQTYLGPVVAPSVSLVALGGLTALDAGNDFGSVSLTGGAIALRDANTLDLLSVNVGAGQTLAIQADTVVLHGNVATTADQTWTGNLRFAADAALTAGAGRIGIGGGIDGGGHALQLASANGAADALSIGGATTNVTTLAVNGNARIGAGVTTSGTQTWAGSLTLGGDTVLDAGSGRVDLQGPVAGGGHDLTLASSHAAADAVRLAAGATGIAQLTVDGAATVAGAVTTTGDQRYNGALTLAGATALDAGTSRIRVQGAVNGGGHDLALTSRHSAADALTLAGGATGVAALQANGHATVGADVTTSGAQTWAGTLTLGADATLAAGSSRIDLHGTVDADGHALGLTSSNAAADAIRVRDRVVDATALTVTGRSTLANGVATTGAQLYTDTVTLAGDATFAGTSLGFGNGIVARGDLSLFTQALNLAGTVSGSGRATLATLDATSSIGVAGAAGTLQIDQSTLDRFAGFATLTVGRSDGSGDLTFGNLLLPTRTTVQSASGDVTFAGTIGSAGGTPRDLAVSTSGTTTFAGTVGGGVGSPLALGALTVAGAAIVGASVHTSGTQAWGGDVTVASDLMLSGSALGFAAGLDVGTHDATLWTDALTLVGNATGSGTGRLTVATRDAAGSIGLAGAAGTLQVSQGLLDRLSGVPALALGRSDGTGAIQAGALTLAANLTLVSGSGDVTLDRVDSDATARSLTVTTGGTTTLGAAIGSTRALDSIAVGGASRIGGNVTTTGAQGYGGAATLTADATLAGTSVSFGATLDGAHALTVNAGTTRFGGGVGQAVALDRLVTDAAGTTTLAGAVTTSGAQTFGDALRLEADVALRGSTLTLTGSVDGAQALSLTGTQVLLGGPIGDATALTALTVSGPLSLGAGRVFTTGAQTYGGATTLATDNALQAGSVAFGGTLDGAHALSVQTAGTTAFAATVGATTPLASLAVTGGGPVQIGGAGVATSGAQSYAGALQFAGAATLSGASLALQGPATGATDLTLRTDALTGATALGGSGTLTIAPLSVGTTVGVAGASGSLQVGQAVLDGAAGFTAHVIGRVDGSGDLRVGNLQLRADTTLQTGSGNLDLQGSVDGNRALVLMGGGTTRIGGAIGASTPLASLTVDNRAGVADSTDGTTGERTVIDSVDATGSARIVTTGAQNWLEPVVATVPVILSGGAIVAAQRGNRFEQAVAASATSLDLFSATDLRLGNVTLAGGGTLETDGVLRIAGALRLDGGTLRLVANGTPTVVDFADPELLGRVLAYGFTPLGENSATVVQEAGGTLSSAAGTLLVVRATQGGSIALDGPGNTLLGRLSAVSGTPGTADITRLSGGDRVGLGFVRIASSEIHVAGAAPSAPDATAVEAGVEGDAIKLTADVLTTGSDGLIRARLPFNNVQGAQTSVPGITFVMTPQALAQGGGFGGPNQSDYIRIRVGGAEGGFITARPNGASGDTAVIFLGGPVEFRPFYDGAGRITEIRVFYNGDAPRTPQEAGALAAVIALIEDARHARFEEAVRTENVSSRLRSGVIAEVGAGRPATVGRESIKLPEVCDLKSQSLACER